MYSAAVRAASNEAARGRRRKMRFCIMSDSSCTQKKGKRGDYMDRERERFQMKKEEREIFFNFTSEIQFTFFNRIF